jgi:hypothetical protein
VRNTWKVRSYFADRSAKRGHLTGLNSNGRRISALLYWSLNEVTQTASEVKKPAFEAELVVGWLMKNELPIGHSWVRVNWLATTPSHSIDLDPTWYPSFTPLFPRLTGLSQLARDRYTNLCREAQLCLIKARIRDSENRKL